MYVSLDGIVVAVVQWLFLRRLATHAEWWLMASSIGWLLGLCTAPAARRS